jgi:4'-phosphopantetheinyl transferase
LLHLLNAIFAAHSERISIGSNRITEIIIRAYRRSVSSESEASLPRWQTAPTPLQLNAGDTHLWLLLDGALTAAALQHHLLTNDEHERAARLEGGRARSFIGTRATLRLLLARYTSEAPQDIRFSYGPLGKPAYEAGGVHFSISHAGDRALLAFSRTAAVGIDLERVKTHRRFDALTARFFSADNARTIALASPSALPRVFAEAWAQREAYVKAVGGGLYATADALPFTPGRIPLQRVSDPNAGLWSIVSVDAGHEYEGKLVSAGDAGRLFHYTLSPSDARS